MSKVIFSYLTCALYILLSSCESKKLPKSNAKEVWLDTISSADLHENLLQSINNNPSYSRIEIYCWCFNSTKAVRDSNGGIHLPISICTTPIRVDQSDLIKPIRLYISISDSLKIESIKRLFFNNISESKIIKDPTSARFVALFRRNYSFPDTLLYSDDAEFIYNSRYLYKYSFNVMDSLKRILALENITCKN
jgi:hypothetical protein